MGGAGACAAHSSVESIEEPSFAAASFLPAGPLIRKSKESRISCSSRDHNKFGERI